MQSSAQFREVAPHTTAQIRKPGPENRHTAGRRRGQHEMDLVGQQLTSVSTKSDAFPSALPSNPAGGTSPGRAGPQGHREGLLCSLGKDLQQSSFGFARVSLLSVYQGKVWAYAADSIAKLCLQHPAENRRDAEALSWSPHWPFSPRWLPKALSPW